MTATARKKRVWTVADFAMHVFRDDAPKTLLRSRRMLKRLDAKHGGALLIPSQGTNREYTFMVGQLAKLEPELFTPVESLEFRVEELEETVAESFERLSADQKIIASQTAQNSRDIARIRVRVRAA